MLTNNDKKSIIKEQICKKQQLFDKRVNIHVNVLIKDFVWIIIILKKEEIIMPNIKPISDLRNYTEVLKEVTVGNPVYLTRNGRGEFAIVRIEEMDQLIAAAKLSKELAIGERSGREEGWLAADVVEKELGVDV